MSQDSDFLRVLGRRDVLALSFGAMVGWSWVVLTGSWIQSAGSLGAVIAFAVGGLAVFLIGLTYAELASAMPKVGGEHVYSLRALGPLGSFVCTWSIILGYIAVAAFEAVAFPTVMEYLIPNINHGFLWTIAGWDVYSSWVLIGVTGTVAITWVNVRGIETAAFIQALAAGLILLVGVVFLTGAFANGSVSHAAPLLPEGLSGVAVVLIAVPFMLVGFDVIPQAAEEINLPYRSIGKVLLVSVAMAVLWYSLMILGVSLSLDNEGKTAAKLVTADASAAVWGGSWAGDLLVLGGIAGIITSWNAFVVGGSRAIYALAEGGMLPAFLARLHPQHRTPYMAIYLIGFLSCLAPLFGRQTLVWLVNAGGLGVVVAYGLVTLSFLVLRKKEPELERPFTVPCGLWVGSLALLSAVGLMALYMPGSPSALSWPYEWGIIFAWIMLGVVFYVWAKFFNVAVNSSHHSQSDISQSSELSSS